MLHPSTSSRLIFLTVILSFSLAVGDIPTTAGGAAGVTSTAALPLAAAHNVAPAAAAADLEVIKADSPDPVIAGHQLTYTITVTNHPPQPPATPASAANVTLTDTLPNEVSFVSSTPGSPTCTHSGAPFGGTVTCNLGILAPNASAVVTIVVTVLPSTPSGFILNVAAVTTTTTELPFPEGTFPNEDEEETRVIAPTPTPTPTATPTPVPRPVGGYGEPLSAFELLGPWIILVTGIATGGVMIAVAFRRRKV